MAARNEEVYIYLRAVGASQSRRDIDSVRDSLERLDNKTGDLTGTTEENTNVTKENTKTRRSSKKVITDEEKQMAKLQRTTLRLNRALQKIQEQEQSRSRRVFESSVRARAQYERDVKRQQDAALRAAWARVREEARIERQRELQIARSARMAERAARDERVRLARLALDHAKYQRKIEKQQNTLKKTRSVFLSAAVPKIPTFRRPGRILLISSLIMGLLDIIPVVGTALNSMLAGAIGAINGLAPLFGLFAAIPAGILAMTQFGVVATLAFNNIGKAIGGDEEAMKKLTEHSAKFVEAVQGLKPYLDDLRTNIQEIALKNLADTLRDVTRTYMPVLNTQLGRTAEIINTRIRGAGDWLTSASGKETSTNILKTNNRLINIGSDAMVQFVIAFMQLADAGGPVMVRFTRDVRRLAKYVRAFTGNRKEDIAAYFDRSYTSLQRVGRVARNFGLAFRNIFKASAPMSKFLADTFARLSNQLLRWTKSPEGIKQLDTYFREMIPNLKAVGRFAWEFARAVFRISRSKSFIKIMDRITGKNGSGLIPALEKLITAFGGDFVELIISFVEGLARLGADHGVIDALTDIGDKVIWVFGKLIDFYNWLPDWGKRAVVTGLVVGGIFGGIANAVFGAVAAFVGLIKAFKMWRGAAAALKGTQAAGVAGLGGGGGVVAAGGGKGKKGKPRRASGVVTAGGGKPRRAKSSRVSNRGLSNGVGAMGAVAGGLVGAQIAGGLMNMGGGVATPVGAAARNFDAFFKNDRGEDLYKHYIRPVNDLNSAMSTLANYNPSGFHATLSTFVGAETPIDRIKTAFGNLDTELASMPDKDAEAAFLRIRNAAIRQKVPVDKLIEAFPQYRDKVLGTLSPMDRATVSAGNLSAKMAGVDSAVRRIDLSKLQRIDELANRNLGLTPGFGPSLSASYAGNSLGSGQLSMTGELGPEMTITRSGKFGMVGLNGPELFKPTEQTAVVPSSATFDPMSGNYGNAPDWARMALQRAISNSSTLSTPNISKGRRSDSTPSQNYFQFSGDITVRNREDLEAIKSAVISAIEEKERDRRERR